MIVINDSVLLIGSIPYLVDNHRVKALESTVDGGLTDFLLQLRIFNDSLKITTMATKPKAAAAKPSFDPKNLSEKDQDLLTLNLDALVKKYGHSKKSLVDRRYALRKKFQAAGVPMPQPAAGGGGEAPRSVAKDNVPAKPVVKAATPKKVGAQPKKVAAPAAVKKTASKPPVKKQAAPVAKAPAPQSQAAPATPQAVQFELNGQFFKLNFFPKKVAQDPVTKVIEISI